VDERSQNARPPTIGGYMSRRPMLLAHICACVLSLALAGGCAKGPSPVVEPIALIDDEFDESTPEGTLRVFLREAKKRNYREVGRLSEGFYQNHEGRHFCHFEQVADFMNHPSVLRLEFTFRKSVGGSLRSADLILIKQNGRFRGSRPLEMTKFIGLHERTGWKVDYGWECVLTGGNFQERVH
jgi:hypothetical protein